MQETSSDPLTQGIQLRDRWQFELKSEMHPFVEGSKSVQTQEFYFFVPNSLQINSQTYTKTQFYQDQTNLIRFKTPNFALGEICDPKQIESPFIQVSKLCKGPETETTREEIQTEVKLLGDIFNSSLRDGIAGFIKKLDSSQTSEEKQRFVEKFTRYLDTLADFREQFKSLQKECLSGWPQKWVEHPFQYIDEFISYTIEDYLSQFLNRLRLKSQPEFYPIDKQVCDLILQEQEYRHVHFDEAELTAETGPHDEYILYRKAMLNKFAIDPLLLKTSRASVDQRYKMLIGGIPAAIAMLIYSILFVWQWNYFLQNSEPFIVMTVILYVLKDRLKEELRFLSYQKAAKWFSDYTTNIFFDGSDLGTLRESFTFVQEEQIPAEISEMRHREFHGIMETFKRPEQIIYYKKTITIREKPQIVQERFDAINILFRLDIHHFLNKAEDPYQTQLSLDENTQVLRRIQLPRVYHLNIILKTTLEAGEGTPQAQLRKYRLVVDKSGIKRIEYV